MLKNITHTMLKVRYNVLMFNTHMKGNIMNMMMEVFGKNASDGQIEVIDDDVYISSRYIAAEFDKRHDNVLQDIRDMVKNIAKSNLLKIQEIAPESNQSNFQEIDFGVEVYEDGGVLKTEDISNVDGDTPKTGLISSEGGIPKTGDISNVDGGESKSNRLNFQEIDLGVGKKIITRQYIDVRNRKYNHLMLSERLTLNLVAKYDDNIRMAIIDKVYHYHDIIVLQHKQLVEQLKKSNVLSIDSITSKGTSTISPNFAQMQRDRIMNDCIIESIDSKSTQSYINNTPDILPASEIIWRKLKVRIDLNTASKFGRYLSMNAKDLNIEKSVKTERLVNGGEHSVNNYDAQYHERIAEIYKSWSVNAGYSNLRNSKKEISYTPCFSDDDMIF